MAEFSGRGFVEFTPIAPSIWAYVPRNPYHLRCPLSDEVATPSLVLLCSWTEAPLGHVEKYTKVYQRLFPFTRIMVITTSVKDLCFRTSSQESERLRPAVEQIRSYQQFDPAGRPGAILMHVFSEGGSHKACELAEAYFRATTTQLPVAALCLDSTPGRPRYLRLCKAINNTLPLTPLLRHTGPLLSAALVGCVWIFYCTVKDFDDNVITRTRERILDRTYWNLSAPRCYLYSRADALVFWRDVEDHILQSTSQNIPVKAVPFVDTGHVRHSVSEGEMYWNAVLETWRRAMATDK
jgi:hypothetical protein